MQELTDLVKFVHGLKPTVNINAVAEQQMRDDARLEEIRQLSHSVISHGHCNNCGRCLITGETHSPCVPEKEWHRLTGIMRSMRPKG